MGSSDLVSLFFYIFYLYRLGKVNMFAGVFLVLVLFTFSNFNSVYIVFLVVCNLSAMMIDK